MEEESFEKATTNARCDSAVTTINSKNNTIHKRVSFFIISKKKKSFQLNLAANISQLVDMLNQC